jgi:hypothetical protein
MAQAPNLQNLGEVPICIAIDKSGSTYGQTLREQIAVVEKLCSLRSPRNENPIKLLPWCDKAETLISLPEEGFKMKSLYSEGGTNPSVLYTSHDSVQALSNCGLWFLLTDGQIDDILVQEFAIATAQIGLHGTACVVIVFGSTMSRPPADCDVSVGVAAYAVAPDCLFLFQDVDTRRLLIMQAKGCFKFLLAKIGPCPTQPVLNKYTTWAELPTISYTDLSQVKLAPPRKVAPDELALQDGLVIRMKDLYSGKVDDERVGELIRNEDNLKSLVIAEIARGTGKDLQNWLDTQQKAIPPDLTRERPDIEGKAQAAVTQLLRGFEGNETKEVLDTLRNVLRRAHRDNLRVFGNQSAVFTSQTFSVGRARQHSQQSQVSAGIEDRPTFVSPQRSYSYQASASIGYKYTPTPTNTFPPPAALNEPNTTNSDPEDYMHLTSTLTCTFLPGFHRYAKDQQSEYSGNCMLCKEHAVLVILMKSPPEINTTNFPTSGSYSPLAFPLAMSSFAETDIVSFFLCCDSCALYLVKNCTSPLRETITGGLALTSIKHNEEAWLDVIDVALKGRFRKADLPSLFIAILDRKILENRSLPPRADQSDGVLYNDALIWAKTQLAKIAVVPLTLSPAFRRSQRPGGYPMTRKDSLLTIISERTLIDPGDPENLDIAMLRYPVPGFMVLVRLMRDHAVAPEQLQTHLFQRLIYYITENYYANLESNGNTSIVQSLQTLLQPKSVQEIPNSVMQDQEQGLVVSVFIGTLLQHNLIDPNTLATFRTMSGFQQVETQTGSATAVYLHYLLAKGLTHRSAIDLFNAFKVHLGMGKVIMTPFAISEGLAGDLIPQI